MSGDSNHKKAWAHIIAAGARVIAVVGGIATVGAAFYWGGNLNSRVEALETAEASGTARGEARKGIKEIEKRLGKIEAGMARSEERQQNAREQRERIEGKIDGLIRRLTPPIRIRR